MLGTGGAAGMLSSAISRCDNGSVLYIGASIVRASACAIILLCSDGPTCKQGLNVEEVQEFSLYIQNYPAATCAVRCGHRTYIYLVRPYPEAINKWYVYVILSSTMHIRTYPHNVSKEYIVLYTIEQTVQIFTNATIAKIFRIQKFTALSSHNHHFGVICSTCHATTQLSTAHKLNRHCRVHNQFSGIMCTQNIATFTLNSGV